MSQQLQEAGASGGRRRSCAFSASVLACLLLSGCTPVPEQEVNGSLAPSLRELAAQWIQRDPLSDWDRAVVEKAIRTGSISQADYDEGADNFEACLKENGLHWVRTRLLNGVVEFQPPRNAPDDGSIDLAAVQDACYVSTWQTTQELFRLQQANPDLLTNFSLAAVNCLKKAGVVGDAFTTEEFDKVMGPTDAPIAQWPFDLKDPRTKTCLYSLGYVVSVEGQ